MTAAKHKTNGSAIIMCIEVGTFPIYDWFSWACRQICLESFKYYLFFDYRL